MIASRKISRFFQGPFFIAALTGIFVGLSVAAFLAGRLQVDLTTQFSRHLQARLESVRPQDSSVRRFRDYRRLAGLSIWGKAAGMGGELTPETGTAAPLSGVSYTLKGVVRYPDGTYEAVIADQGHKTFFLRPGDSQGNMKIVTILPDRLVVEQGGKRGTIELFRKHSAKGRAYGKAERRIPPPRSAMAGRATHVVLKKAEVQNALKDMATFLRQVRIVPYLKKGSAKGFKLLEIVPGSIVARVGLRNGDIIESVNGKPIQTPQDAFQLFTSLQAGKGISLVYKRNHRGKTVVIDLQ